MNTYFSSLGIENKSLLRPSGFQDLLQQAITARDLATQKARSQELVKMMANEAMVIPLYSSSESVVFQKNVHNIQWYLRWGEAVWGPADTWLSK
ncbi:MAG: hypothetical protein HY667_06080 [Chloroflexi bacterium]|nr:hypothetical protein [Chloroflexota bacterium]